MLKGRLLLVVALALSFTVLGLACSDDSDDETTSGSLDAYFAELGVIGNEFLDDLVVLPGGIDESMPIAQQVDVYETYLSDISADIEEAQDALNDVEPPDEVAQAHGVLVVSVDNALKTAEDVEGQIGDINTSEDMIALTGNNDILTALADFRNACMTLKDIAEENDIDRVVRCE